MKFILNKRMHGRRVVIVLVSRPERRWPSTNAAPLFAIAGALFGLRRLGRRSGATAREAWKALPGDEIVGDPMWQSTRAITIAVPPEQVWPWIVQMGYHRGGWYTPRWVDRWVWHIDNPSAEALLPDLQGLTVGDVVPDGEPGTAWYDVVELEPARHLVLYSTTHVPPALGRVMHVAWTWTFVLEPIPTGTRLRLRARARGNVVAFLFWHLIVVPSDYVMAPAMLDGIRERAERASPATPPGPTEPSPTG